MHVLLTGITGFIAHHIAAQLLEAGHQVRGSLRDMDRADGVRTVMPPHTLDRLSFVELDLLSDDGWEAAAEGVDAILHVASPFPMSQRKADPDWLVRPAVDGTLRALRAAKAAGVDRVILTSSVVAVENSARPDGRPYDERDWSTPDHPNSRANSYVRSKTEAERAAWAFAEAEGIALTTLNPGLVLGPALAPRWGTSLSIIERLLSGKDPMMPPVTIAVVDVRDVARAHVAALTRPETAGERYILVAGTMTFTDIARVTKDAAPDRKVPTRTAPPFLVKALAMFDPALKSIVPILGRELEISGDKARTGLGIDYIPGEEAVRASVATVLGAEA